ncbi:methyl-accepting chemotaxis protein [Pseudoduganella lutea]|uniref:Methyl-accepting chemotaxis protein n=1 Tax=Pseudoduganella lutea TaxID=321985 RepID=A0A4P6L4J2_9BURK|nr:methyl-accepting chemotaxis protein [Pseudoduganella lutea]QBE66354.1 methyl-accepting chemotaxis protein [Pseudoduganella lutea]
MNWFYRLTVASKLRLAFGITVALTLLLGGFSLLKLDSVNQTSTEMEVNWMPSVRYAGDMNTATSDFRIAELQHILSHDEAEMTNYERTLEQVGKTLASSRTEYERLISSNEEQQLYDKFSVAWNAYLSQHREVIALSRANRNDDAKALLRGRSQELFDQASTDLQRIVDANIAGGKAASRSGDALYASARNWITALLTAAFLISVTLATAIARVLVRQLGGEPVDAASAAASIAAGDLTVEIHTRAGDSTSMMCSISHMRDSLAAIVQTVQSSTQMIASASSQVAAGSMDLSSRTEEQASSLEETASSMEELTATVRQNADNARQGQVLANTATSVADKGSAVIGQVVGTMDEIATAAGMIADITSVIDGIAFQTNILALNAAVEAARAGEQGRGFAVVAAEVRNLAQRAGVASKEIKGLIENSVTKVANGSALVNEAGATMAEILDSVRRVNDIMAEISSASGEQSAGIEQINAAVVQMDQVTQQNAALVEEAAAASESMQGQAAQLLRAVSIFKLSPTEVTSVVPEGALRYATAPTDIRQKRTQLATVP